ncbi:hypothetical protein [Photorhabdus laumondii]|uniref:hypothetical protein n=1 Tax=Photorhabdus laumondii TaxID=2218628 RepID=UPI0015EC1813|nr:hypothetical protein [Photorhabdus laumondii]
MASLAALPHKCPKVFYALGSLPTVTPDRFKQAKNSSKMSVAKTRATIDFLYSRKQSEQYFDHFEYPRKQCERASNKHLMKFR